MIYDKFAPGYDKLFAPLEQRFLSRWREEALAFLPENSAILEIGTGLNFKFYPPCRRAVAGDISGRMLLYAKEKTTAIDLVQADAQILPFEANTFDAAFATLVFCSIPDSKKAFAELRRVVSTGGRVILLEHVRPFGALGYVFDLINIFTSRLIGNHFNRRTAKLAEDAGLKVVEIRKKMFGIVNLIVCEIKE